MSTRGHNPFRFRASSAGPSGTVRNTKGTSGVMVFALMLLFGVPLISRSLDWRFAAAFGVSAVAVVVAVKVRNRRLARRLADLAVEPDSDR